MLKALCLVACAAGLPAAAVAADAGAARPAESSLTRVRAGIEQWVETRQLVSRTRSDWDAEKEILNQSKVLYQRELAGLAEQMGKVATNSVQVDRERAGADRELQEANAALEHAREDLVAIEGRIRSLVVRLPLPLGDAIKGHLARLPEDSQSSKLGATERLQTVVSILNEADKFNNAVGIYPEKRKNPAGDEVSVDTLYVGLGAAFFVNETGDFAGVGNPGAQGWDWAVNTAIAPAVREAVRIYRGERSATFVPLPVTIR